MRNLDAVVSDYIRRFRHLAKAEMVSFAREPSLAAAVSRAARSELPNGKRHSHQYRIPVISLKQAEARLLSKLSELQGVNNFEQLHSFVKAEIEDLWMIGPLVIYDISTRIGAFRGIEPRLVCLHCGTRDGARALGFVGVNILDPKILPRSFHKLTAQEIEDCLCIYKDVIRSGIRISGRGCERITLRSRTCG